MNRPSSIDDRITDWLEDGPTTGPARALAAAHARTRSTRQLPAWVVRLRGGGLDSPWRTTPLFNSRLAFAIVTAMLVASLAAGAALVAARLLSNGPQLDVPMVAFDAEGDIFVVRADGTALRRLTSDEAVDVSPVWSPDGHWIAYWSSLDRATSLLVLDVVTGERAVVADDVGEVQHWQQASWSPDGRTLAYHASGGSLSTHLFLARADGSQPPVRVPDGMLFAMNPAWSPDGTRLAYRGQPAGPDGPGVFVLEQDAAGSFDQAVPVRVSPSGYGTDANSWLLPRWTADGSAVVTHAAPTPDDIAAVVRIAHDIVRLATDGSGPSTLATGPGDDWYPTLSADGRRLSFISHHVGVDGPAVIVAEADGANPRRLDTPQPTNGSPLNWSPDGRQLLGYRCERGCDLLLLTVDGSVAPLSVPTPGRLGLGSWQPAAVPIAIGSEVASVGPATG